MNLRRLPAGLGLALLLAATGAGAGNAQVANPNALPPPPVPNPSASALLPLAPPPPTAAPSGARPATPAPSPSPSGPVRGQRPPRAARATPSPEPTDTPEPPQFSTLDGIWEIELQPIGARLAQYEHFSLIQNGSSLTGYWEHNGRVRTPIVGQFDGSHLVQIQADWNGGTVIFAGYVDNMGDMVGMRHLTVTDPGIAFTAQHRKKGG